MSASPPELRRVRRPGLFLALAALALGACTERDADTRPFHLAVTGPDGASLAVGDAPVLLTFLGTAAVPGPTTFVVGGAVRVVDPQDPAADVPAGDVTLSFDGAAAPDLAFPARLAGQAVMVEVAVVPGATGPVGEPLPVWVIRIATGPRLAPTYELTMGETTAERTDGIAGVPAVLGPFFGDEDVPAFLVEADWTDYQPAECGLVYLDALRVFAPDGSSIVLRPGETGQRAVGLRPDPWNVRHVLSWHRRGKCGGQSGTWTQIAAWR